MKRLLVSIFVLSLPLGVQAQEHAGAWAWKPLFEHEGLVVKFIFYREADTVHNGVVIMLSNTNSYPVDYRFKVVFRSGASEVVEPVNGSLKPGESKTGDSDGLFWIPFKDGQEIAEVGLRGYRVTPRRDGGLSP